MIKSIAAGPDPKYATKERVEQIVVKALKDAKFRRTDNFIWERPLQGAEGKTKQIVNGLSPYFPDIQVRGGEEILQFKDLRPEQDDYIVTMKGKFGALVFTIAGKKIRVVEQWIDPKAQQTPSVKVPEKKAVNVKLPPFRVGQRFVIQHGTNLEQAYKKELAPLIKVSSRDDIPGLIEYNRMEPGDHLELTYQIVQANEKFIKFREWLRVRTDKKSSFYLHDAVHMQKIKAIQAKITNYKQLYVSYVDEDFIPHEGHHRLIAAALLGAKKFPVMVVRLVKASM